jgi:hypothetical protein
MSADGKIKSFDQRVVAAYYNRSHGCTKETYFVVDRDNVSYRQSRGMWTT